jgi:hypothetical protein
VEIVFERSKRFTGGGIVITSGSNGDFILLAGIGEGLDVTAAGGGFGISMPQSGIHKRDVPIRVNGPRRDGGRGSHRESALGLPEKLEKGVAEGPDTYKKQN